MASKNKFLQRLLMISNGAVFQLFNAFSTAIIAYYVIAYHNTLIWGKFASIWIMISLFTLLFNFGSKDYLVKEYSKSKVIVASLTSTIMFLRLPLILLCILIALIIFPFDQFKYILPLLLATFFVNSIQPRLVYEKRFGLLLGMELIALFSQFIFLSFVKTSIQLNHIIISFLVYNSIKVIIMISIYRKEILPQSIEIKFSFFKPLIPFFLLALGGMMVNKADFIMVTALLDDSSKAHYHIISTFSTMGIIAAHAVLQPFMKEIFRINWESFKRIAQKYFGVGIILSLLFVMAVNFVTDIFFNFHLSKYALILLYAIELIFFAYNPIIFLLFRTDKQHHLVFIVIVSGCVTLFFAWLLVKPYGINGALLSNLIGNAVMFIILWLSKARMNAVLTSSTIDNAGA
jgi:O-antigen/teichoic acid export membrane protein